MFDKVGEKGRPAAASRGGGGEQEGVEAAEREANETWARVQGWGDDIQALPLVHKLQVRTSPSPLAPISLALSLSSLMSFSLSSVSSLSSN